MFSKNTRSFKIASLALALTSLIPTLSGAAVYSNGSKTTTFDVTLKIVADCTIATAQLDFGQNQGIIVSAIDVNTNLTVTCTNTTPYNLALSAGSGTGSTIGARKMSGTGANTSTVSFNLYQDTSKTLWGDTQGANTKSGTGTGAAQTVTVYGEIPAQPTPQPDTYKSTITATIYF